MKSTLTKIVAVFAIALMTYGSADAGWFSWGSGGSGGGGFGGAAAGWGSEGVDLLARVTSEPFTHTCVLFTCWPHIAS